MIDGAIDELSPDRRHDRGVGGGRESTGPAGIAGTARARRRRRPERVATPQPRALTPVERKQIKALLESDEFVDEAPATVYAKLLDEGTYLGSVSTMYRILREHDEVRERRRQATHPAHKKPELIAHGPNEIWSLGHHQAARPGEVDLLLPLRDPRHLQPLRRGLDAGPGRTGRARQATDQRHDRQTGRAEGPAHPPLRPGLAHDRQAGRPPARRPRRHQVPQPAARVATTTLIQKANSGPSSTDPTSPTASAASRTPTPTAAASSVGTTTTTVIRASGFHTPADVHYGRAEAIRDRRGVVLLDAYAEHPERFVRKIPTPPALPVAAWINQPKEEAADSSNQ